jgi:hypothetical protein
VVSTYPSEKYEFLMVPQLGGFFSIYGKIKKGPNHQLYKKTQDGAVLIFRHVVLDVPKCVAQTSTASIEKTTG